MYNCAILIRLRKETAEKVGEVARARDEHISDFVRRAILRELARLGFLNEQGSKALGLPIRGGDHESF